MDKTKVLTIKDTIVSVILAFIGGFLVIITSRKLLKADVTNKKLKEDKISSENVHFLLEHKLSYLNTVSNVCMSWWVSSVVFCGSIVAAVWLNRKDLVESGIILWLGFVVAIFFAGFILFGIRIDKYLSRLKTNISCLTKELKPPGLKQNLTQTFNIEIETIKCGVWIGIGTFIFILIVWIALFLTLYLNCWKNS